MSFQGQIGRTGGTKVNSATRQDVRFDALSVSINELKQQARETNTLLRELAQRP